MCLFSLKMTSGVCSLPQLHIYQMSVDVRRRENNSGPLTHSLHPHHGSSTQICLLWVLRLSSEVLVRSLMTSCISQANLTMTIPTGSQTLTQDNSPTSDTTTTDASPRRDKQKNKNQGKRLAPICSMAVSMETHRETHVLNPTLTLSLLSVCLKLSSYLSVAVREPVWIWCVYAFLPCAFCVRPRLHVHGPMRCQIH